MTKNSNVQKQSGSGPEGERNNASPTKNTGEENPERFGVDMESTYGTAKPAG